MQKSFLKRTLILRILGILRGEPLNGQGWVAGRRGANITEGTITKN
ncbi:hypothetical protein X929_07985 [Petrotoga olearia DSM 13574]|uniref:Uncharacterized protein n=1 Tax=Petrotoga olearia DSM 13574 TaxID=1122955 RepID=A0A2K1NYI1_9BACT|nr:hypothetical protein X929_07985 [Petrotoga olearia DSM 13574]